MFLRSCTLSLIIFSCSISNCMEKKSTSGTAKHNNVVIEYSFFPDSSNQFTVSKHLNNPTMPLLAMHHNNIADPFKAITNTIEQTWSEWWQNKGANKPIDNKVLTALTQSHFSGIIVILKHLQDNNKNFHQLHIFNINTNRTVRAWYPELDGSNNVFVQNTAQHISEALQHNRTIITVTPSDDLKNMEKKTTKQLSLKNKLFVGAAKVAFNKKKINSFAKGVFKSIVENHIDEGDLDTANQAINSHTTINNTNSATLMMQITKNSQSKT